jgi:hypothetical protein
MRSSYRLGGAFCESISVRFVSGGTLSAANQEPYLTKPFCPRPFLEFFSGLKPSPLNKSSSSILAFDSSSSSLTAKLLVTDSSRFLGIECGAVTWASRVVRGVIIATFPFPSGVVFSDFIAARNGVDVAEVRKALSGRRGVCGSADSREDLDRIWLGFIHDARGLASTLEVLASLLRSGGGVGRDN